MNVRQWWGRHVSSARPDYKPAALAGGIAGAGVGMAAGAVVGYAQGLENLEHQEITAVPYRYQASRPVLVGADYDDVDRRYQPDGNGGGRWVRQDDDWDPIFRQEPHKEYEGVRFERSVGFADSPLGRALIGAGTGLLVGAALGVATGLVVRAAGYQGSFDDQKWSRYALPAGAATGAAVGGALGYLAGTRELAARTEVVVTAPTYERRQVGWMPREGDQIPQQYRHGGSDFKIYYSELPKSFGDPPFAGRDPVYASVPVGEEQTVVASHGSHSLLGSVLVGAGTGAVFGLAAGIAAGSLMRLLSAPEAGS